MRWFGNKEVKLNKLRVKLAAISAKKKKLEEICQMTGVIWPPQKDMMIFYAGREASIKEQVAILEKEVDRIVSKKLGVQI